MAWWGRLRRRRDLERQLDAELRDHVERLTAQYVAAGLSDQEAGRKARLDFGGLDPNGTQAIGRALQERPAALLCGWLVKSGIDDNCPAGYFSQQLLIIKVRPEDVSERNRIAALILFRGQKDNRAAGGEGNLVQAGRRHAW